MKGGNNKTRVKMEIMNTQHIKISPKNYYLKTEKNTYKNTETSGEMHR